MAYPEDLLSAEDKAALELEKAFLKSVSITVKETDWKKLEENLAAHAAGNDIVDGVAWKDYDPKEALKNLFEVCLAAHGEYIGSIIGGAKFDYVDPHALDWISQYGADEIKYISDSQKEAIKKIVLDGYQNGITVQKQAQQIRNCIGLDPQRSETLQKYAENLFARGKSEAEVWRLMERRGKALLNSRALTIAINEASEASGRAAYQSTKSAVERGVIDPNQYEGFRIVTGDERTCSICMAVEGEARVLPNGTYPSSGQVTAKKHIKCLAPDTRVLAPGGAVAITRSIYSGKLYRFTLSNGANITTTGNHLILTRNGFASANLLRKGDDILNCPDFKGVLSSDPNEDGYIPTIEEIFNSISVHLGMLPAVVPPAAEDFHGDGRFINGDVDIIRPDGLLRSTIESAFSQPIETDIFSPSYFGGVGISLQGDRSVTEMFKALANTADCIVGGHRQSSPFFLRRLGHSQEHSSAPVPGLNPIFQKSSGDDVPLITEVRSQRIDRHPGIVEADKLGLIENTSGISRMHPDSGFMKAVGNDGGITTEMRCNCPDGLTGLVAASEIVHIDIQSYHGYVYDIQSISTLLIGNGIIVSNCRCVEGLREKTKGDSSTMHFDSFKFGGKIIEKTDLITVVPALLTEEGVQNRGLKRWDEFYDPTGLQGYMWFESKPVTRGHPGHKVDNQTPKLGRIRNVRPDPTTKQVHAELELFNASLTKDEMMLVDSGEQIGGSIGYDCGILVLDETKIWEPTGEEYDFEYIGPIYGDHFAIFVDPACKRCGLNTDSKCNCKKELAMTEKPPAQSGKEGVPAQAGVQDDGKKGTVPAPATKKSMKDQAATAQEYLTELIVRAKTVLEISDEYTRYREAAAILLEIATDNFVGASAPIGDEMKNDALAEFRKELDAQKAALDALKADNDKLKAEREAREQADKARQEDATKAGIKELLLPAAQADFEAKHWPAIKQDGFNTWVARPENAVLLAVNKATGKIEPVGQRFVAHAGTDSKDKEFDAGIDAALEKVR